MTAIAARGRGLVTTVLPADVLGEVDRAPGFAELAAVLARAGVTTAARDADAIDRLTRERAAADFAALARWAAALAPLELDEDRRGLRAIARGIAGGLSLATRIAGTVPTRRLPARAIADLADATSLADLAARLRRRAHPLAPAFEGARELIEIELALARRFAELTRGRSSDHALRACLAQLFDVENASAALLLAARRGRLEPSFIAGGAQLSRATFIAASMSTVDVARHRIADAFAGTPIAEALFRGDLDDAALDWQLRTQARWRRIEPLGLAPAIYAILRRRDEARRLRRAAWRLAFGGAA